MFACPAATLAVLLLFVQPEFLFVILRGEIVRIASLSCAIISSLPSPGGIGSRNSITAGPGNFA